MNKLSYYLSCFQKLRRDRKNGGAPHKPILLISIIQAFQSGIITSNKIDITPDLVALFKSNWNNLVITNHHCLFTLPFYHMSSEPFWELIPNKGCELWVQSKSSMRSFNNLRTAIKYAQIDEELFNILKDKDSADILSIFLLDTYFNLSKDNYESSNYVSSIQSQILNDSPFTYQDRIKKIRTQLDDSAFMEEIYVRGNIFKKEIPKIYNHACCISELRIDSILNASLLDACHIIPFSESYNDTINNGFALCPNLHRAFDRGLISIGDNYEVIVSSTFVESSNTSYGIRQFEGKKITLPKNPDYLPSLEAFKFHRNRFGF
jgi:putative restriction endonuclease